MTRQDYVKLARALADTRPERDLAKLDGAYGSHERGYAVGLINAWSATREAIARALAGDARFDRDKFIRATES